MPIIHNVDQYSEAYNKLKLGIPTSSCFDKIITPTGKPSSQWRSYACHLIAERLLGRDVGTYTSPFMERGMELEPEAVEFYEFQEDIKVETVGFITDDKGRWGCSPDRLIGDDGLLEIKVPAPGTQVEYLIANEMDKELRVPILLKAHRPQLQGQLFVSERKWTDILAFHPEMPPSIVRVERDEEFIAKLESLLIEVDDFINKAMKKIAETQSLTQIAGAINHEQQKISY